MRDQDQGSERNLIKTQSIKGSGLRACDQGQGSEYDWSKNSEYGQDQDQGLVCNHGQGSPREQDQFSEYNQG